MKHSKGTGQDVFWATEIISSWTLRLGYLAMALFVGHQSFGLPDFGITFWHLLAIGLGGSIAVWASLAYEGWRVENSLTRRLRSVGFTKEEIKQLQ